MQEWDDAMCKTRTAAVRFGWRSIYDDAFMMNLFAKMEYSIHKCIISV